MKLHITEEQANMLTDGALDLLLHLTPEIYIDWHLDHEELFDLGRLLSIIERLGETSNINYKIEKDSNTRVWNISVTYKGGSLGVALEGASGYELVDALWLSIVYNIGYILDGE